MSEIYIDNNSNTLDIVLQGGNYGIESPFMQKVITSCKESGHSVLAFNFPYFERGDNHSSGPELKEELETITKMMKKHDANKFDHIRFVAKSLGGIVASYFLKNLKPSEHQKYSIVILGYVLGDVNLKNFSGKIKIIQGEKDKFGNIGEVKEDLKGAISNEIEFTEIKGADHSFKNPDTGEPEFADEVVKQIN